MQATPVSTNEEPKMDALIKKVKLKVRKHIEAEKAYLKKLLFPLKLFPVKLVIYFFYYPVRISFAVIKWSIVSFIKAMIWPFKKLSNFFKTIFWILLLTYLFFTFVVILDYISKYYGHYSKFFCSIEHYNLESELEDKVVRIVGGYSEGSGFFIDKNRVLTNFHVIANEPYPKVIFPDGSFETPEKIVGNSSADLAVLYLPNDHSNYVMELMDPISLYTEETLLAAGYPLGTNLPGPITIQKGKFSTYRSGSQMYTSYIQTDIELIEGMSGGPLLERCGKVVGVNTLGLSGLSLFIPSQDVKSLSPAFTDADIKKITLDTSTPEGAVTAFYIHLKARKMEEGFALLSKEYLKKTNFEEWTNRFTDILDVDVIATKKEENSKDMVFVKFTTKNWDGTDVTYHYYEGIWKTVFEDGEYKMNNSNIREVTTPSWDWFYN